MNLARLKNLNRANWFLLAGGLLALSSGRDGSGALTGAVVGAQNAISNTIVNIVTNLIEAKNLTDQAELTYAGDLSRPNELAWSGRRYYITLGYKL